MTKFQFKPQFCEIALKLAINKISILINQKIIEERIQRKIVERLFQENKENEKERELRNHVERLIQFDFNRDCLVKLKDNCEQILNNFESFTSSQDCPENLKFSVATIIYTSKKIKLQEFTELTKVHFKAKFGLPFVQQHLNSPHQVVKTCISKLKKKEVDPSTILEYLNEIAKSIQIQFNPQESVPYLIEEIEEKNKQETENDQMDGNSMIEQNDDENDDENGNKLLDPTSSDSSNNLSSDQDSN
ncbi:ist1 [Anaeramoeba ignava]|uniref:Ist1 n=1 Tax=Anaeramoeba ignava TaxID=1746090 RepID=A0A9Q0L5J9_ANAIG|nr:ist1 [Anaeramoeba ignava]